MNNYSLDTPVNRKLYAFTDKDIPFAPAYQPKPPSETDQTHRNLTWLHHKPTVVQIPTVAGRDKKK